MSEQPLVPGTDADSAPVAAPAAEDAGSGPAGQRRRLLLLGGGGAAVAGLAAAAYLTLGGGGDTAPVAAPLPRPHRAVQPQALPGHPAAKTSAARPASGKPAAGVPAAKPAPSTAPVTGGAAKGQPEALGALPPTFTGTHLRDPFKPLIAPPAPPAPSAAPAQAAAAAPARTAPASPASSTTGRSSGTAAPTGTAPSGSASSPTASSNGSGAVGPQVVHLVDTSSTGIRVTVNGKLYAPRLGSTFATYFKLLGVQGSCSTMEYGDAAFDLCKGHTVTVQ